MHDCDEGTLFFLIITYLIYVDLHYLFFFFFLGLVLFMRWVLQLTFTLLSHMDGNKFALNITYLRQFPPPASTPTMACNIKSIGCSSLSSSSSSSSSELTHSQALQLTAMFATLAVLLPFMLQIYHEYLAFLALGQGGTASTVTGFLRVKTLSLFALRDPYQPAPVPKHLRGVPGYLSTLPVRSQPRPETRGIAPHRQVTQRASRKTFEKLAAAIDRMGTSSETLALGTSCFVRALSLRCPTKFGEC